jgi:hypothetical protein
MQNKEDLSLLRSKVPFEMVFSDKDIYVVTVGYKLLFHDAVTFCYQKFPRPAKSLKKYQTPDFKENCHRSTIKLQIGFIIIGGYLI